MQLYHSIFQKSWKITKQNKIFWLFGLIALFWGGKGMEFELYFTNGNLLESPLSPFNPDFWRFEVWSILTDSPLLNGFGAMMFVLSGLVLAVVAFVVIMVAQIGLVDGYARVSKTRKRKPPFYTMGDVMKAKRKHFADVAAVNLIGKTLSYALLALAVLPLFGFVAPGRQFLSSFIMFLTVTPVTIIISILVKYTVSNIIIAGKPVGEALRTAWNMLWSNLGVTIELAVMMLLAYFAVSIVAIIGATLVVLPLLLLGVVLFNVLDVSIAIYLYYIFSYAVAVGAVVLASSIFSAWHYGNWTLLYMELTKGPKQSKVYRAFKGEAVGKTDGKATK